MTVSEYQGAFDIEGYGLGEGLYLIPKANLRLLRDDINQVLNEGNNMISNEKIVKLTPGAKVKVNLKVKEVIFGEDGIECVLVPLDAESYTLNSIRVFSLYIEGGVINGEPSDE